jgi:hypothetical protein
MGAGRVVRAAVVGLALGGGVIGVGASPASADGRGALTCSNTKPNVALLIDTTTPVWFNQYAVQYHCTGHTSFGLECEWDGLFWANGTITGPYNQSCT